MKLKHLVLGMAIGFAVYGAIGCATEVGGDDVTKVESAQVVSNYRIVYLQSSNMATQEFGGDWAPGWAKTQCGGSSPFMIGISWNTSWTYPTYGLTSNHLIDCNSTGWNYDASNRTTLNVRSQNDDRAPPPGYPVDWAPNLYKGTCPFNQAIVGIATDPHFPYGLAYIECARVTNRPPSNLNYQGENRWVSFGPFREAASEPALSWDIGYHLDQCGDGRFLVGIAHGYDPSVAAFVCGGLPYNTPTGP